MKHLRFLAVLGTFLTFLMSSTTGVMASAGDNDEAPSGCFWGCLKKTAKTAIVLLPTAMEITTMALQVANNKDPDDLGEILAQLETNPHLYGSVIDALVPQLGGGEEEVEALKVLIREGLEVGKTFKEIKEEYQGVTAKDKLDKKAANFVQLVDTHGLEELDPEVLEALRQATEKPKASSSSHSKKKKKKSRHGKKE